MTKEELLELGLEEDQIKEVFRLNGLAIENVRTEVETKETEITELSNQLQAAEESIASFESMDVEDIKDEVEKWKQDYEALKTDMEQREFDRQLDNVIYNLKGKNAAAIKALVDKEGLQGKEIDEIKAEFEKVRSEYEYMFEEIPAKGTGGSVGNRQKQDKTDSEEENFGAKLASGKTKDNTDTSRYELK